MLFGLFKRTKIAEWETALLKNVIQLLPAEYHPLETQINEGLLNRVLIGASDLPGYVAFTFNSAVIRKFEKRKARGYKLTGLLVFDIKSKSYLKYTLYVSSGVISGYSIEGEKKFVVDVSNISVKDFKKAYYTNPDYQKIEPYLNKQEREAINQDDVYEVELDNKIYFHIKDLEDGDFIGMDYEKNIYKITHDPFEIKRLDVDLSKICK